MDSLTQIVLGAGVGEAVLGKKVGNKAILWGAIAGTIPDLDVLANFFTDELTATEMHRGFSHSILFAILMAPLLGWLASRIHKKANLDWKPWSWLMFWSLVTHPLLDAHTNWGTTLLWPLDYKFAYNNIFIVDPLYTLPFMVCVIWAMTLKRDNPKRSRINRLGLIMSTSYMALTIVSKGIGYYHFTKSLDNQGIAYERMMTNATVFNSILWNATVETEDEYLLGYYSLFDGSGEVEFMHFDKNHNALGDMADEDIVKRLAKISRGWYIVMKDGDKAYINDMRFGQMGISDDPDSFPFSHELWYEDGVLHSKQRERGREDAGSKLGAMIRRVAGK
ncbi:MAG: metal-dependent hydrolase [Flavobacteriales bacterium]